MMQSFKDLLKSIKEAREKAEQEKMGKQTSLFASQNKKNEGKQ